MNAFARRLGQADSCLAGKTPLSTPSPGPSGSAHGPTAHPSGAVSDLPFVFCLLRI